MSHAVATVLLVTVGVAVGAAAVVLLARRGRMQELLRIPEAQPPLTQIEAHLGGATPGHGIPRVGSNPLSRDEQRTVEEREAREDIERLKTMLRDIRDITVADEAIFWSWQAERDTLVPSAWSTEDAGRPEHFDIAGWSPLVRWSAEEQVVHFAGDVDGLPVLASAPVITGERLLGVLTVSAERGLALGREAGRTWFPRFAAQLASASELFDLRRKYGRDMRQNDALLEAVHRLHQKRDAESLGKQICITAREATSSPAAVLVRWYGDAGGGDSGGEGVVQATSGDTSAKVGDRVPWDSLVGSVCREKLPLVLSDATAATLTVSAFGKEGAGLARSLAIVPVMSEQGTTIGAIVVAGRNPGDLGEHESRNINSLAHVLRGPLEIVWEIEEVQRRARTDALTGLNNRRQLDEELKRLIRESDRFGKPCSAILADLDHFKNVNDTHGHDAGDAALKHVADVLREGVRAVDICARYGGEELAILLPQTDGVGALDLAERLRARLEARPVRYGDTEIPITASFGVATYPEPVPYGDMLLLAADRALYDAKQAGRNRVRSVSKSAVTPDLYRNRR